MIYESKGQIPVKLHRDPSHGLELGVREKEFFFFWGTLPLERKIQVDIEFLKRWKLQEVSGLEVIEGQTFLDSVITLLSLGTVTPRSYDLRAYGK